MRGGVKYMGITNLTDDSFVRGDRMGGKSADAVVSFIGGLLSDGADIIDIGACSTAPGVSPVGEDEEWSRMEKILPAVFESFPDAVFSIDSFREGVLRAAYGLAKLFLNCPSDQFIINNVSPSPSASLMDFAAAEGIWYVATDGSNDPYSYFEGFAAFASAHSLHRWMLDPGFGFGKSVERNWEILDNLECFRSFGHPVLAGLSRKRMIWMRYGLTPESCAEQSVEAEKLAIAGGADIIRTHDLTLHTRPGSHRS